MGKVLYYSLSSILIDRDELESLCDAVGFPKGRSNRTAMGDAFRSATGDIYERRVVKTDSGPQIFKVYCRDNKGGNASVISRELVKETVHEDTNEYRKLANITFNKTSKLFSYDNLVSDPFIDPLPYCMEAQRLFELYQNCAGRRQIETLLENYVDSMQAVKIGRGHFFFVPRDFAARLQVFEDFVEMLEEHNQLKRPDRDPLEVNSIYVVDDAKQRKKMTAAFYRSVRREIAEYEERVTHLIQSGSQSPKIMDRWVMRIQGLEEKKRNYENILKRELTDLDEEFTSLRYLSDELRIRAAGLRVHQKGRLKYLEWRSKMNKEKKDRPSIEAPQAVKHPDKHPPCYRSETRNPYPLCLGWGMKACAHCCLWTDYDSDEDESRVNLPLSLAQLQEMDGTPAWWECGPEYSCWGIIAVDSSGRWEGIPFFQGRWREVNFVYNIEARNMEIYRHPPYEET